jgi:hypothetical protein
MDSCILGTNAQVLVPYTMAIVGRGRSTHERQPVDVEVCSWLAKAVLDGRLHA